MSRINRIDRIIAGALVAVTIVIAWGVSAAAGILNVPRTDDWGFVREAIDLHRTGSLHLISWGPMTKIAHLLWAQPFLTVFGEHQWVLNLSTTVLVCAGIVAAYWLARTRLQPAGAALTVLALLVFPGVVRDTASYMTDPAALSMQLVTLAFGGGALLASGRRRWLLFAASMVAGCWAFSIRELAVAAPVAVIVTMFVVVPDRPSRSRVALGGGACMAVCLGVWVWHRSLSGVEQYRGRPALTTSVIVIVSTVLTVALAVAPALAVSLPRWWHTRHRRARAAGAAVGALVVMARPLLAQHVHAHNWWFVGDYLQADGVNGGKMLLGYRPVVLNDGLWHVLVGVAVVSAVICGALLGEWVAEWSTADGRARRFDAHPVARLSGWHVAVSATTLTVAALWNGLMFDRYLWPLVFSASFLLLARSPIEDRVAVPRLVGVAQIVGTFVGVVAVITVALLTLDSAAFDAARWHAGEEAVRSGTPANEVDAGVEWSGAHSVLPNRGGTPAITDPLISWWSHMTGMERVCMVVTASPVGSSLGTEVVTHHWRTWLLAGDATLHVYRLTAPACP
jgi:hypothetical protein